MCVWRKSTLNNAIPFENKPGKMVNGVFNMLSNQLTGIRPAPTGALKNLPFKHKIYSLCALYSISALTGESGPWQLNTDWG